MRTGDDANSDSQNNTSYRLLKIYYIPGCMLHALHGSSITKTREGNLQHKT